MYTLKCFWAGQLVRNVPAASLKSVHRELEKLKDQIEKGTLVHSSCGSSFILKELCVDAVANDGNATFYSLKKD